MLAHAQQRVASLPVGVGAVGGCQDQSKAVASQRGAGAGRRKQRW